MALVLVFYAATRVVGIVDFPIYFFCDEATHANLAEDLIANGLRDREGNFLPPYFRNARKFNLSLSVWVLAPFVAIFGKSVAVVRLTTGLIGLLGAASLMLTLKIGFRNRLWWIAGLVIFLNTHGRGLSPSYWFVDNPEVMVRHRMLGYGHLPIWLVPVILLGAIVAIHRSPRSAPHRLVLIAVLAAPFSAAVVDIRITRVLAMMAPATILAVIGIDWVRDRLRRRVPTAVFAPAVAAGLVAASTAMTADALTNGATWFHDYGLYGMQWGARQLYGELERRLEADPEVVFVVSHSWANFPEAFTRFFIEPSLQSRVRHRVIGELIENDRPSSISQHQRFVLTANEYRGAVASEALEVGEPFHVIPYPDGQPGFIFARIAYSATVRDHFEEEHR